MEFEEPLWDTKRSQPVSKRPVNLDGQTISNGSQKLDSSKRIQAPSGQSIIFGPSKESSLAKVEFQTNKGAIRYQLYLGNGKN